MSYLKLLSQIAILSSFLSISPTCALSAATIRREPIGRVTSLDRSKLDPASDANFYQNPNLVAHTDEEFIQRLQDVYHQYLPQPQQQEEDGPVILDIMSSHVSHLPPELCFGRVDVHGMNARELEMNPARAQSNGKILVRDLNENPSFIGLVDQDDEAGHGYYDAVLCCVGVQYLEDAEAVFAEVGRILQPETGVVIISFTNRFFYQKALQGWINRGMKERARLVEDYLRAAGGFDDIQVVGDGTSAWKQLASVGGLAGDPFVAVVAKRNKDP